MKSNNEIWRCASLLVDQYGEMALNGAAIKADQLAREGDQKGRFMWLKVTRAVEELLSDEIPHDVSVH